MPPPSDASDYSLADNDNIDIPVVVRNALSPRKFRAWARATQPWPTGRNGVPPSGTYLVSTNWREIAHRALTVGRDPMHWLAKYPNLSRHELISRLSPLQAHLTRRPAKSPQEAKGWRLVPSVIYQHQSERTTRATFAYRLGMTMAEWTCRSLMGLGPTEDAERVTPSGVKVWNVAGRRPDLHGQHPTAPRLWLIEAKAAGRLGLRQLREGEEQLRAVSKTLNGHPHRLILCGTTIHEHLAVTVGDLPPMDPAPGTEPPGGTGPGGEPEDRLDDDNDALLAVARERMLIYLYLRYGPHPPRVIAVGSQPALPERRHALTLLERDERTIQVRERLREHPPTTSRDIRAVPGADDFLTAPLPELNLHVGMSRRLYAACGALFGQWRLIAEEQEDIGEQLDWPIFGGYLAEAGAELDFDIQGHWRSLRFHQAERARRGEMTPDVRQAYEEAEGRDWFSLLPGDQQPPVALDAGRALEAKTAHSYIAIDPAEPILVGGAPSA